MEAEGHRILKLNIGNPAPFGFEAPEEILQDVILQPADAHGYGDSKGLLSARRAVVQYYQEQERRRRRHRGRLPRQRRLRADRHGAAGAARQRRRGARPVARTTRCGPPRSSLCGGRAVHYLCDETDDWMPDLDDIAAKVTPRTKAIVVINPNNPTGAVYSREMLERIAEVARRHNLLIFSDEIYDKILYDDAKHVSTAAARPGPVQPDVQRPVEGVPGGRLPHRLDGAVRARSSTRPATSRASTSSPTCGCAPTCRRSTRCRPRSAATRASTTWSCPAAGCSTSATRPGRCSTRSRACRAPNRMGALYVFPRLDPEVHPIEDDLQFALDLLRKEKLLVVQGTGFNWPQPGPFPHRDPARAWRTSRTRSGASAGSSARIGRSDRLSEQGDSGPRWCGPALPPDNGPGPSFRWPWPCQRRG